MCYHQYANIAHCYSRPWIRCCLEAVMIWLGDNKLKLNRRKTKLLFMCWHPLLLSEVFLDRQALPIREKVCNLGVLLNSWLLLQHRYPSPSSAGASTVELPGEGELCYSYHHQVKLVPSSWAILEEFGAILKEHTETTADLKCSGRHSFGLPTGGTFWPVLQTLHLLPTGFWLQFKMIKSSFPINISLSTFPRLTTQERQPDELILLYSKATLTEFFKSKSKNLPLSLLTAWSIRVGLS